MHLWFAQQIRNVTSRRAPLGGPRANPTAHDKRRRWRLSSRTGPQPKPLRPSFPTDSQFHSSRLAFFFRPTQWWPLASASRCCYSSPCSSAPRGRAHASSPPSACRPTARTTPSGHAGPCSSPVPMATTTTATRYIRAPVQFLSAPFRRSIETDPRSCCVIGLLAAYSIPLFPSRLRNLISFVM